MIYQLFIQEDWSTENRWFDSFDSFDCKSYVEKREKEEGISFDCTVSVVYYGYFASQNMIYSMCDCRPHKWYNT